MNTCWCLWWYDASDKMVWYVLSARKQRRRPQVFYMIYHYRCCYWSKRAKYIDLIKKEKIYILTNQQEMKKKHQTIPQDAYELLSNVLGLFDKKGLDLKHVLQWPDTSKPWAICSKVDQRWSSSKSLFRNNLQLMSHAPCTTTIPPDISSYIVDVRCVVRMMPITDCITTWNNYLEP